MAVEAVATRVAAAATREAVAAASETAVTVRMVAVVVTVTEVLLGTVVVTDHTQEEDSAAVDPKYLLLLKAEKASCFQTILGSKLRIKATLSTFTMLSMANSMPEKADSKLLGALPTNSRGSSAFIFLMAAKFTAPLESSKFYSYLNIFNMIIVMSPHSLFPLKAKSVKSRFQLTRRFPSMSRPMSFARKLI